eukprot:6281023-Prymnesium_polylepis.1
MGIGDAAIWAQISELVDSIKMKAGDGNAAAYACQIRHLPDTSNNHSQISTRAYPLTVGSRPLYMAGCRWHASPTCAAAAHLLGREAKTGCSPFRQSSARNAPT